MKKIITSLCLSFMFIVAAFSESKALILIGGTYYVVSGESFSLTPSLASLFEYQWLLDPGSNQVASTLNAASGGVFTKYLEWYPTAPEIHKLTLGCFVEVGGCFSECN